MILFIYRKGPAVFYSHYNIMKRRGKREDITAQWRPIVVGDIMASINNYG